MTVNTLANEKERIDPERKYMLSLLKTPAEFVLSDKRTAISYVVNGTKVSTTAVACDVEEDTQSVSSDDESVYIDNDFSESGHELDLMLSKYLAMELHPKVDEGVEKGTLVDDEGNDNGKETNPKSRRKVCIAENHVTSKVLCIEYADPFTLDPSEFHERWYTPTEFQQFRHANHKAAKVARRSKCISDFAFVYEACASSDKFRALTQRHKRAMSETEYRGLESSLLFGIVLTNRKSYIRQILKTQQQHNSLDRWTLDECTEALAVQAHFLTTKARRLAQVLGAGDALVLDEPDVSETSSVVRSTSPPPMNQSRTHTRTLANVVVKDSRDSAMFEV